MKLYGYAASTKPPLEIVPDVLAEVSLAALAIELRAMAEFLIGCADGMERMADSFDHVHLSDRLKSFRTSPQFVVARDTSA